MYVVSTFALRLDVLLTLATVLYPFPTACAQKNKDNASSHVPRCMTYVECYSLSADTLNKILAAFPMAKKLTKRAAVLLSLRRFLIRHAKAYRKAMEAKTGQSSLSNTFVDQIMGFAAITDVLEGFSSGGRTTQAGPVTEVLKDVQAVMRQQSALHGEVDALRNQVNALTTGMSQLLQAQGLKALEISRPPNETTPTWT